MNEDYNISINIRQFTGAVISNLKFQDGSVKRCAIIPIDEAGLFDGEKGTYINLFAKKLKEQKFGQSHCLRVTYPKDKFISMYPEQKSAIPLVGHMRPVGGYTPLSSEQNMASKTQAIEINELF